MLREQVSKPLKIQGREVQSDMIGSLRDANRNGDLKEQLLRNGYLLLRGLHDPQAMQPSRHGILQRQVEVEESIEPARTGIAPRQSTRDEMHSDRATFWSFL